MVTLGIQEKQKKIFDETLETGFVQEFNVDGIVCREILDSGHISLGLMLREFPQAVMYVQPALLKEMAEYLSELADELETTHEDAPEDEFVDKPTYVPVDMDKYSVWAELSDEDDQLLEELFN